MARATTIWVVMDSPDNPVIVAAFTVKHEMMTWLDRNPTARDLCRVFKCVDNPCPGWAYGYDTVREIPVGEL